MKLDVERAGRAVDGLARGLGLGRLETAWAYTTWSTRTWRARHGCTSRRRGLDPRRFTLVATGGAGPVHAVEVAAKLGIRHVLCPVAAGAGSCLGLLAAPGGSIGRPPGSSRSIGSTRSISDAPSHDSIGKPSESWGQSAAARCVGSSGTGALRRTGQRN